MTMKTIANVCTHLIAYGEPSIADLTDEHLALCPAPGAKTAGWILGHLAVSGDYVRRKCGCTPMTPKEWGPRYAPGTQPAIDRAQYPSMNELRDAVRNIYKDLAVIGPSIPNEVLAAPTSLSYVRDAFPVFGDFVCHIMTGHLGYHLGQLVEWRSAVGLRIPSGMPLPI